MQADPAFTGEPGAFWANVRTISQALGYSVRGSGQVSAHKLDAIIGAMERSGLQSHHLRGEGGEETPLGRKLEDYFTHRARVLNGLVEPRLMDVDRARDVYSELHARLAPRCPIPMNKQRGEKRAPAYFTGIVNMLIERHSHGCPVDYDPRKLTTVTRDAQPVRTLARRVDGAFPAPLNPVSIWEIKEYYYTTTFGSRIADGVYETLLDGMELMELATSEGIRVQHLLMVDGHYTWWQCGRSYLCRIIDMLHMGLVDEVLFGHEVVERLPRIVAGWVDLYRRIALDP